MRLIIKAIMVIWNYIKGAFDLVKNNGLNSTKIFVQRLI